MSGSSISKTQQGAGFWLWLQRVFAALLLVSVAACADQLNTKVTRFQSQLPPPQGQSFVVVADNPQLAGGIEFGQYAQLVSQQLTKYGYTQAANPDAAALVVRFSYGVDNGREKLTSYGPAYDPFWGPWRGYRGGYWGGGWAGGGWGGRGAWGWGWYDPWFDGGLQSYTVYTSGISMKIDDKASGKRLFEGKAQAVSQSNKLSYLVPNLIEAMFTGFPGDSGETLRITVAPEKTSVHKDN